MEEVREVVDIDLGITEHNQTAPQKDLQAFLYISNANKVIAAAFVEHIEKVSNMPIGVIAKVKEKLRNKKKLPFIVPKNKLPFIVPTNIIHMLPDLFKVVVVSPKFWITLSSYNTHYTFTHLFYPGLPMHRFQ